VRILPRLSLGRNNLENKKGKGGQPRAFLLYMGGEGNRRRTNRRPRQKKRPESEKKKKKKRRIRAALLQLASTRKEKKGNRDRADIMSCVQEILEADLQKKKGKEISINNPTLFY